MRKFMINVNGKSYEVDVEEITGGAQPAAFTAPTAPAAPAAPAAAPAPAAKPAEEAAPAPAEAPAAPKANIDIEVDD